MVEGHPSPRALWEVNRSLGWSSTLLSSCSCFHDRQVLIPVHTPVGHLPSNHRHRDFPGELTYDAWSCLPSDVELCGLLRDKKLHWKNMFNYKKILSGPGETSQPLPVLLLQNLVLGTHIRQPTATCNPSPVDPVPSLGLGEHTHTLECSVMFYSFDILGGLPRSS